MSALQEVTNFILSIDPTLQSNPFTTIQQAIQTFDGLFLSHPRPFAIQFDYLATLLEAIIGGIEADLQNKIHLFEFLVTILDKYPKLVKTNQERITKLFKVSLQISTQIAEEPTAQWMKPANGFDDEEMGDNDELVFNKQVLSTVDKLSELVGFSQTINYLQPLFLTCMQNTSNWRYPYAALMVASQIAVEDATVNQLSLFTQWALSATEHQHPKVRYAALQLIGQFSDDLNPQFQEAIYEQFVPISLKRLEDNVPRVVAHSLACNTNFFENCQEVWKIENVLGKYLTPIIALIKSGNSWIVENSVGMLASFATTQNSYGPNLPNIFNLGFDIVRSVKEQHQFTQTLNQTFEMLSLLILHQGKSSVEAFVTPFISLLFDNQSFLGNDYFLQAWQRVCLAFENFADLTVYYPRLLNNSRCMEGFNFSDSQIASGLSSLGSTFISFKHTATPFVQETFDYAKQILQRKSNSLKLRQQAFKLMISTKVYNRPLPQPQSQLTSWKSEASNIHNYTSALIQERLKEQDYQELPFLFQGLHELVIAMGNCLNNAELQLIAEKQLSYSETINAAYDTEQTIKKELQKSEDELQSEGEVAVIDQELDYFSQCLDSIPEILKEVMKLSSEPSIKLAIIQKLKQTIERCMSQDPFMMLYAANLSVTILEGLQHNQIGFIYARLIEMYVQFSKSSNARVRNGGIYGINLIIQKSPTSGFSSQQISQVLLIISDGLTQPFEEGTDNFYANHCKDNVISALGSVIKHYHVLFPEVVNQQVLTHWLANIPLNTDKTEGNKQQQLLIDIINQNPSLVVKDCNDIKTICQIFAKFVIKRKDKEFKEVVKKTRLTLEVMKQWTVFQENTEYLWAHLSPSHRDTLTRLMNSDE